MKKCLAAVIVIALLVPGTAFAKKETKKKEAKKSEKAAELSDKLKPMIGLDMPGWGSASNKETTSGDIGFGFNLALEYIHPMSKLWSLGLGLEYQFMRSVTKWEGHSVSGQDFNFLPMYATVEVKPFQRKTYDPVFKLNLGWVIWYDGSKDFQGSLDMKGSFYWDLGVGMVFIDRIWVALMFGQYRGERSGSGSSVDDTYSRFVLKAGYIFDLPFKW
jgi:hypothetical protein